MLTVGLTGGIGSGKSLAGQYFEALEVPLLDTDVIAKELLSPDNATFEQVADMLGSSYIDNHGFLNRGKLREAIFSDDNLRQQLENIMHPAIYGRTVQWLSRLHTDCYVILVVPLLIETNFIDLVNRILVIDSSKENQISRVALRDNQSTTSIDKIITAQLDRKIRLTTADDVITNNSGIIELRDAVQIQHQKYRLLANCT